LQEITVGASQAVAVNHPTTVKEGVSMPRLRVFPSPLVDLQAVFLELLLAVFPNPEQCVELPGLTLHGAYECHTVCWLAASDTRSE
jgi:hypothetical protein